ncbi:MAG: prolyl oligopeptidase family serine peptidase [Bacteroidia bacterium]|nr:prolyl oligopeptidase family serine peptidase [Bacteroidia bacterium]
MLKKIMLFLVFLLLAIYFAVAYYFSDMLLIPKGTNISDVRNKSIRRTGFDYQKVYSSLGNLKEFSVKGAHDAEIKGWYYQKDNAPCAVIMAHGWGSNRTGSLKYSRLFEDCDCDLIFYDHRAHNESGCPYGTGGVLEAEDLITVTDWVQKQNGLKDAQTGWLGVSWGAATVLQAAGQSKRELAFIIADSPFENWHTATTERADKWFGKWTRIFTPALKLFVWLRTGTSFDDASSISHVNNIQAPVFLIHSQGDQSTGSQQSVNISKHLPDESEFHHTQWGSDHTRDITEHPEKFQQLVDAFMDKYVPEFGCY